MSKGSKRRPPQVPDKQIAENWAKAFGIKEMQDKQNERINKKKVK